MDPSQIPSVMRPEHVTPNLVDPNTPDIPRIGIYVLLPLMLCFLALRIGTRLKLAGTLTSDDVMCVLAATCTIVFSAVILPYLGSPIGPHEWDVPVSETTDRFIQFVFLSVVLSNLSLMFIKVSLLAFYLRIFNPVSWARSAIWLGVGTVFIFYSVCDIVLLAVCVPKDGISYVELVEKTHCAAVQIKVALAVGWFGTFIDFYVLAIPIRLISNLLLDMQRKIGLMAVFLTGLLACGASTAGLAQRYRLSYSEKTDSDSLSYIYVLMEINIAIICSCMPIIAAPLRIMIIRAASLWSSVKKGSQTLLSPITQTKTKSRNQLPGIPNADISGLRTFIRRFQRSHSQDTPVVVDMSNFSRIGSVDEQYHQELRAIHENGPASTPGASAPGSRAQTSHGGV